MAYLTIGELAKKCSISKVAIRYYERCSLIPKAIRGNSGYRIFPEAIIDQIHFIKNARSVGFTLKEINELLILKQSKETTSQQIKLHTMAKLENIYEKIYSLQWMANTIKKLVTACDGKVPLSDCPILQGLYGHLEE